MDLAADCVYKTLRNDKTPLCDCDHEHYRNTFHFSWVIVALCVVQHFQDRKYNVWAVHSLSERGRLYKYINMYSPQAGSVLCVTLGVSCQQPRRKQGQLWGQWGGCGGQGKASHLSSWQGLLPLTSWLCS